MLDFDKFTRPQTAAQHAATIATLRAAVDDAESAVLECETRLHASLILSGDAERTVAAWTRTPDADAHLENALMHAGSACTAVRSLFQRRDELNERTADARTALFYAQDFWLRRGRARARKAARRSA